MISGYPYRDYFYDQSHKKNILIVSQKTRVTSRPGKPPVIDTSAVKNPIIITNDDIYKEEFELQEAICSSNNLSFGSCEAGIIKFTIRNTKRIPYMNEVTATTSHEEILKLYFYFDDDSASLMYYGMYICQKDQTSEMGDTRSVEAVDMIGWMRDFDIYSWYRWFFLKLNPEKDKEQQLTGTDKDLTVEDEEEHPVAVLTVKQIRDGLFNFINGTEADVPSKIKLDFTVPIVQENVDLPNDDWKFQYKVNTGKLSLMQLLEDVCEVNGRFGHIGRQLSSNDSCVFEYVKLPKYNSTIDPYNVIKNDYATKNRKRDYYITKGIRILSIYNEDAKEISKYYKGVEFNKDGTQKTDYSEYIIHDNKFIDSISVDSSEAKKLKKMLQNIYNTIRYRTYTPYQITVQADLCRELGDRIIIINDFDPYDILDLDKENFKSYILERSIKGIQNMVETYTAKGDRVIPKFGDSGSSSSYYSYNGGSFSTQSNPSSNSGTSGDTNENGSIKDGVASPSDLVEYARNFGFRLLDEPNVVYELTDKGNSFKWTDPADITTNRPVPATWQGTVVVRKKGSPPRHRWDFNKSSGGLLVDSKVRDEYKDEAIVDDGSVLPAISSTADYYYGIFPYDEKGYFRYTKVIKAQKKIKQAPTVSIDKIEEDEMTFNYQMPPGNYKTVTMVLKAGDIPEDETDGMAIDINPDETSVKVRTGEEGEYYAVIFAVEGEDDDVESNVVNGKTTKKPVPPRHGPGFYDADDIMVLSWEEANPTMTGYSGYSYAIQDANSIYNICKNNPSVVSIYVPDNDMTTINQYSFYLGYSKIKTIDFPNSITEVAPYAIYDSDYLENIYGLGNVTKVDNFGLSNLWNLKNIDINVGNLLYIGNNAFANNKAPFNISINKNISYLGSNAFVNCENTYLNEPLVLPGSLVTINMSVFQGCSGLHNDLIIEDGITKIDSSAFILCGFTSIYIPASCSNIVSYGCFDGCDDVTSVIIDSGNPTYYSDDCNGIFLKSNNKLFAGFKTTTIPSKCTGLNAYAFYRRTVPEDFRWSVFTTSIPAYVFSCAKFKMGTNLTLPSTVTSIGSEAFRYSENIETIYGAKVRTLSSKVFNYCYKLKTVNFPELTSVGYDSFAYCSSLETITTTTVTSLGSGVFNNATNLTSISLPNLKNSIDNDAFKYCSKLSNIEIGTMVTSIGENAFYYCAALTSIKIPNSVISINKKAFTNCGNLTIIYYSGTATGAPWGATNATVVPA